MFYDALATVIENAGRNQLDECSRQVSRALGGDNLTDDQADQLYGLIQVRRGPSGAGCGLAASMPTVAPRRFYIQRSPEQRSPNRWASIRRRREHAATGPLPPSIALGFTVGELAVLRVVSDEWLAHGASDRSLKELAARAGVCRALAKRAVRLAEIDGLITVQRRPRSGRKHWTNIIHIIRAEWVDWLDKGNRKTAAIRACHKAKPDFKQFRGVNLNPPRSQAYTKAGGARVDNTVSKGNWAGANRA